MTSYEVYGGYSWFFCKFIEVCHYLYIGLYSRCSDWVCGLNRRGGTELKSWCGQEFSFLHVVKTNYGTHPASYTVGTGGISPRVNRLGCKADHLVQLLPRPKNVYLYLQSPNTCSWPSTELVKQGTVLPCNLTS
jgi:hypothetical protein